MRLNYKRVVYGILKCPEDCNNKDVMCMNCVDGSYFDSNAQ